MNHAAFKDFLQGNKISLRSFERFCRTDDISKTMLYRLSSSNYTGRPKVETLQKVVPALITHSRRWMEAHGLLAEEIDRILSEIFEEDYQPMICERHKLEPEHLEFFNLDRDPFALEADPRKADEVYTNKELDRIVRRVEDAVKFQGFVSILGPVGAGKTILKQRIADRLKKTGKAELLWPRFAEMGKLNAGGIVHYLLEEFGQRGRARLPLAQRQLEKQLAQYSDAGRPVAMIIDECHRLSDATLSALKNFYELGTGGYEKYLSLVLLGQLSFKRRLENSEFREIAERVEVINMPSLSKHAGEYITHRISLAGGEVKKLFSEEALHIIASQASTPLAIGNLANRALIEAFKKDEHKVIARFLEKDTDPKVRQLKKVASA
jgi:type II secretory pathway predicted ATPase ExeA